MIHNIFAEKSKPKKRVEPKIKGKVIIDFREKNSFVPTQLVKQGLEVEFQELKIADYIVKQTAIERKTVSDFVSSMINKRIFSQLKEIKQYENHLLIVEGDLSSIKNIHPNALKGFILSITLKYKVPIVFTKTPSETAQYILLIAKKQSKETSLIQTKANLTPTQELEYILQSFPKIGPTKSKQLFEKFKTIKKIVNAPQKQLEKILGKQSEDFIKILNRAYRI